MSRICAGCFSEEGPSHASASNAPHMKVTSVFPSRPKRLLAGLATVVLAVSGTAFAGTLPVVLDASTENPLAWWAGENGADGLWQQALSAAASSDRRWLDPAEATPTQEPAGLLLRADTTPANALALARLYGADAVLFGQFVVVQQSAVPWLGLERCEVGLTGELISVASGLHRATPALTASAYRPESSAACQAATELLVQVVADYLPGEGERPIGVPSEGLEVVVRSPDSALPFVGFRTALRSAHPAIHDVVEHWASEGRIALRLVLSADASQADVASAIESLPSRNADYSIDSMEREGQSFRFTLRAPSLESPE